MPENKVMTLRLEPGLRKKLDQIALAQRRSRSFIAAEAIREYVALNDWQIDETKKAVLEADRGDFASAGEVERVMSKWAKRGSAGKKQLRGRSRARRAG